MQVDRCWVTTRKGFSGTASTANNNCVPRFLSLVALLEYSALHFIFKFMVDVIWINGTHKLNCQSRRFDMDKQNLTFRYFRLCGWFTFDTVIIWGQCPFHLVDLDLPLEVLQLFNQMGGRALLQNNPQLLGMRNRHLPFLYILPWNVMLDDRCFGQQAWYKTGKLINLVEVSGNK